MPQVDLYITADTTLDAQDALAEIEAIIKAHDDGAGKCKGRAHKLAEFHHSHVLLSLSMLPKDHRDAAYAQDLGDKLADTLAKMARKTTIGVNIKFDLNHYVSR